MGMKFQSGSATKQTVQLTLIGDGTNNAVSLQLTMDPFDVTFNNLPTAVSGPPTVSFGGQYYTAAYELSGNPPLLNITLTATGGAPAAPVSGVTASLAVTLIYQG